MQYPVNDGEKLSSEASSAKHWFDCISLLLSVDFFFSIHFSKGKKKILLISTLFSGLCCSWDLIISQEVIGIGHSAFVITLSSNCHFQKALNSKWHIQGTREATEYHSISHVLPLVFADSMKRDYCDSEDRWQNIVHIPKYQLQQGWTMSAELCWSTSLSTGGLENSSSSTTGTANS